MHAMGSDRLRALLGELNPGDRTLLDCRIVDGWRYGDIAAHISVTRDVLADRLRRLRTDLRRKAKPLGASGFAGGEQAGALGLRSREDGGVAGRLRSRCRRGWRRPVPAKLQGSLAL